jgi:Predicted integral membrane protein (DUF2269)
MNWAFLILLLLHIGGAIIAFGPTFAFPIIGGMGGKEPMYTNFALRLTERIEKGIVLPLAIVQIFTGIGLIWVVPVDLTKAIWLDVAIVLYVIALGIAYLNQLPVTARLIEATRNPPPPPPAGAPAPSGPPPQMAADIRRVQMGGIALTVLLVIITILMVLGTNAALGPNL